MKTKITLSLVLVFVSFVLAGCCTAHIKAKATQWEYAEDDFNTSDITTSVTGLNNSASEGWILVSAVPIKDANGTDEIRYIFKRPKQ